MKTPGVFAVLALLLLGDGSYLGAQSKDKVWRLAVLVSGNRGTNAARDEALRAGLKAFGYVDGANLAIEYRYAEGNTERLPQLARELVGTRPDVIVAGGTGVAVSVKNATTEIPIVVAGAGDLIEAGLIKSFMFPGGNVTGVGRLSPDFFGDRLKLIKEMLPRASGVAVLSNSSNPGHNRGLKDAELGARSSGMTFDNISANSANELDGALKTADQKGKIPLFILSDAMFSSHVKRIADLAIRHKLPAVYDRVNFVDHGGLLSYGVNLPDLSRRAAEYVHQLFKGARPADLTLVQPTKFDLSVNLITTGRIGVTMPPAIIARAERVIR